MNDFRMPKVFMGQILHWFEGGVKGSQPWAAIVTRIADKSLNLNIFDPTSYNMRVRDGVRHMRDPDVREADRIEQGLWDFTPKDTENERRIHDLETQVKRLTEDLDLVKEDNKTIQEMAIEKINEFSEQLRAEPQKSKAK